MSLDAYSVMVRVALVENVMRGLGLMSRHFRQTDADAKVLQQRLDAIGKMTLVGGALLGAGAMGLAALKPAINEAMEYQRQLAKLRQMGLGDSQIADAKKFTEATNVIGTSMRDRLRIFTEAQGSFRESGRTGAEALAAAKVMTPVLANYEVAKGFLAGDKQGAAEQSMRNLNKVVEIMGGLNDPRRAQAIADGVFKAAQSSGGMVDERQLKQFVAYGSSATNQLDIRTIFGGLEPIIGEMGGSTVGTGLRTAYTRTNGMMALMPRRLAAEMQRLHMTDASGKQETTDLARLQATNVIGYAQEIMRRYAAAGITNRTDIERENAIIFGTNGAKIYNKIMSQMPILLQSMAAYDKARGASQMVDDPNNRALIDGTDLEKKEADLKQRIGQAIMPMYIQALEMTADVLERVTAFANSYPTLFKGLIVAFAGLSALAMVSGGLILIGAGFKAIALGARLLPGIITFLGEEMLPMLAGAFEGLGAVLIANPIGLTLAGIAAAVVLLWNNWEEIKTSFEMSLSDLGTAWVKFWHGDMLGAFWDFSIAWMNGWQMLFNTLRAGLNKILPQSMQIPKFTFADRYAQWADSSSHTAQHAQQAQQAVLSGQQAQVRDAIVAEAKRQGATAEQTSLLLGLSSYESSLNPVARGLPIQRAGVNYGDRAHGPFQFMASASRGWDRDDLGQNIAHGVTNFLAGWQKGGRDYAIQQNFGGARRDGTVNYNASDGHVTGRQYIQNVLNRAAQFQTLPPMAAAPQAAGRTATGAAATAQHAQHTKAIQAQNKHLAQIARVANDNAAPSNLQKLGLIFQGIWDAQVAATKANAMVNKTGFEAINKGGAHTFWIEAGKAVRSNLVDRGHDLAAIEKWQQNAPYWKMITALPGPLAVYNNGLLNGIGKMTQHVIDKAYANAKMHQAAKRLHETRTHDLLGTLIGYARDAFEEQRRRAERAAHLHPRSIHVTTHAHVHIDGRKVAHHVKKHIVREMTGPHTTGSSFDPSMSPTRPSQAA